MAEAEANASLTPALDAGINPPPPIVGGDPNVGDPNAAPAPDPKLGPDGKPIAAEPKLGPDGKPIEEPKLGPDGKPIEEKKPEAKAPEEYAEFTMPEGTSLDEASATEFKGLAKELDLTQEQAQKLLSFGGDKIKALTEAPYKAWSEMQTKWQAEVKADAEIGGTKFQDSVKAAALVFQPGESNPFVTNDADAQALRDALNMTGAGNNPALVKLFVRMGNLLKEPGSLTGGPVNKTRQSLADKMYPDMPDTKGE
ncbi:MAG: hypothetical protein ACLQVJ_17110 [Syntrophobacteraceae bacterium]